MKRGRFTSAIIPTLAGAAAALGIAAGPATAATSQPARPVAAHASQPVVFNCLNHAQVRPKSLVLTCADGNDYLTGLSWSSWTPAAAIATGKQMVNDCTPNCATGKFDSYPTMAIFWRAEPVAHHAGEKYFSRVTLLYPGARPPMYKNGKLVPGPDSWTGSLAS
jgi:hypothetical protein